MMCWRGRGHGGARRWRWHAPSSATPRLFSLKPRSERANGSQSLGPHVVCAYGAPGGAATAATTTAGGAVGGSQMRLETRSFSGEPGLHVLEERDNDEIPGSTQEGTGRRATRPDAGRHGGSGQETCGVVLPGALLRHERRTAGRGF